MIALLAICRKVIILDLAETDALHILALAAAILALGIVYWLIRDSDRRVGPISDLSAVAQSAKAEAQSAVHRP
jgi:uncharacterized membrane protein (DUF373 family)